MRGNEHTTGAFQDRVREAEREIDSMMGSRIRMLRRQRGLTLQNLASGTGLSKGFLSHLERGTTSASVGSLYRISDALGVSVAALFQACGTALSRREDRRPSYFGGEGVTDYVLTPATERRVQVLETRVAPQGTPDRSLYSHPGEVSVAYVLRGELEVLFSGEAITLGAGDALTFSPEQPHTWRNPSPDEETLMIWVMLPAQF